MDLKDKGAGNVHTVKSGGFQHLIYRFSHAVGTDHHCSGSQVLKIILRNYPYSLCLQVAHYLFVVYDRAQGIDRGNALFNKLVHLIYRAADAKAETGGLCCFNLHFFCSLPDKENFSRHI